MFHFPPSQNCCLPLPLFFSLWTSAEERRGLWRSRKRPVQLRIERRPFLFFASLAQTPKGPFFLFPSFHFRLSPSPLYSSVFLSFSPETELATFFISRNRYTYGGRPRDKRISTPEGSQLCVGIRGKVCPLFEALSGEEGDFMNGSAAVSPMGEDAFMEKFSSIPT